MPETGTTRRLPRARTVITVAALTLVGAAATAHATSSNSSPSYRMAEVIEGSTSQALTAVGTVQPAEAATVTFPIAGTVATAPVAAGAKVHSGQVLATLDRTSLQAALDSATSRQASAQATLTAARNGQLSAAGGSSGSSGGSGTRAFATAQRRLLVDQRTADTALAASSTALRKAGSACGVDIDPGPAPSSSPEPTGSPEPSSSSEPDDGEGEGEGEDGPAPDPGRCLYAQAEVLKQETAARTALAAVAADVRTLDSLLQASLRTAATSRVTGSGGTGSGGGTTVVSAPQLAAYQAAVDAAEASVEAARQDLAQATITSPIDGVVQSVTLTIGDRVSASSRTASVIVAAPGAQQVVSQVAVTQLPSLKVGQAASVTPDGSTTRLEGRIATIGLLPVSGSTTTYPVTVDLPGTPGLPNGGTATVSFTTASSGRTAVLVPTSALEPVGNRWTVRVVDGGKVTVTPVEVGAVGAQYTEVASGLSVGQQVAVAQTDAPIPTGNIGPGRGFGGGVVMIQGGGGRGSGAGTR